MGGRAETFSAVKFGGEKIDRKRDGMRMGQWDFQGYSLPSKAHHSPFHSFRPVTY